MNCLLPAVAISVLFVDDDLDLRNVIRDTLTFSGDVSSCVLAGSLKEVEAHRSAALACQLAILDINLGPGQPSGVDVAQWLENQGFRGTIVFLTGHGRADPRVARAASVANTEMLSKPITADQLARLVDAARVQP